MQPSESNLKDHLEENITKAFCYFCYLTAKYGLMAVTPFFDLSQKNYLLTELQNLHSEQILP